MSYFSDEKTAAIKAEAIKNLTGHEGDDLWSFLHSTLMSLVESQGGSLQSYRESYGCDGFYTMREFDVNSGAEYLQVAFEAREAFLQERAENGKSG